MPFSATLVSKVDALWMTEIDATLIYQEPVATFFPLKTAVVKWKLPSVCFLQAYWKLEKVRAPEKVCFES